LSKNRINDIIYDTVGEFVGEAPRFDDMTMMCISYNGGKETEGMNGNEITIDATLNNIGVVTDFVNLELEKLNCSPKIMTQIDIAIDELFSNIARYAYNPETGSATVSVELSENPLKVIISFADNGTPYNPLAKEDPDLNLAVSERKRGGLGIFMTKKFMDKVSYEYKDGMNILTIEKLF
jgi:anti-sigma regulatory factor (Ser/Thr protein kinase)